MAKKIVRIAFFLAIVWIVSAAVLSTHVRAQEAASGTATTMGAAPMLNVKVLVGLVIESVVFSVVGLIILLIGYKIFDAVTPYHLNHEIAEDNNTAAGVAIAGLLIALGLIVSAAISG
jgi:uncharacterized membrane protein YjfL (UPF0719 family)